MNRRDQTSRRAVMLCGALFAAMVVVAAAGSRGRLRARANEWRHARRTTQTTKPADEAIEAALVKTDRVLNATALVSETARALLEGPSEANTASP